MAAPPPPAPWRRKVRYHHHDLRASALGRAREIVARGGPLALTLRGLARDLGVTAPALVYHFGSIAGLREAVAESVIEEIEAASGLGHAGAPRSLREKAGDWVDFAAANPDLYRLVSGETWHRSSRRPSGYHGMLMLPSPRRLLERAFGIRPLPAARELSCRVHGLALARVDGLAADEAARQLDGAFRPAG